MLDIAAFVTGVIIDRVSVSSQNEKKKDKERVRKLVNDEREGSLLGMRNGVTWKIVPGLERYMFLTGDYTYMNGVMTYNAIENGVETQLEYPNHGLEAGFYQWSGKTLCSVEIAELLFKGTTGGPQDGVYENCVLNYEEELLTITTDGSDGESRFLGNIGAHIPVYHLSKDEYEVFPAKNICDMREFKAVIALNREGTRIVAVYLVGQSLRWLLERV